MTDETPLYQKSSGRRPIDLAEKPVPLSHLLTLPEEQAQETLLSLPRGQLAVTGLPVAFGGAQSYPVDEEGAVEALSLLRQHPAGEDKPIYNQAQLMELASQRHGFRVGKTLSLTMIPRYHPYTEQERPLDHLALDALGKAIDDGLFAPDGWVARTLRQRTQAPETPQHNR